MFSESFQTLLHEERPFMLVLPQTACAGVWLSAAFMLTLVPDGHASGGSCGVCGQLNEEMSGGAEKTFVGQILNLV